MNNLSCIWLRPFPLFSICPAYFPCNWRARTQNSPDDAWTNGCDFVITKCVKPAFEKAVESRSDRPSTYTFSGHCHWVERESLKIYITGRYLLREIDPILSFNLTRRLFELIWHNDISSWRLLSEKKKMAGRVLEEVGCCRMQFANHMAADASCVKVHVSRSHVGLTREVRIFYTYRINAPIDR